LAGGAFEFGDSGPGPGPGLLSGRLTALFLQNPALDRKGRNPPRKKSPARVLLNFHRRQKKHCF
jgi:hypothetical protein